MDQVLLEREVLKLPARERALLADALVASLDDEDVKQTEQECVAECNDRLRAFRAGETGAVDGPSLIQKLRRGLST